MCLIYYIKYFNKPHTWDKLKAIEFLFFYRFKYFRNIFINSSENILYTYLFKKILHFNIY